MSQTEQQLKMELEALKTEVNGLKETLKATRPQPIDQIQQANLYQQAQRELAEQRKTEAALRESEARFRSLSDSSPIGIFQTDVKGHCSYTNARWQALSGLTFQESLGEGWAKAIHPDDQEAVFSHWNQCVREGQEYEQQFRFLTPQGQVCWVHARAAAIYNDLGEIIGYVGTDEDISEAKCDEVLRKQFEATLHQLNQTLERRVQDRTAELIQVNTNLQHQLIHRQQTEVVMRRQVAREQLLWGITQKIRQSLDLDEILPTAVQEVRQILRADRALIFQLTTDGAGVIIQESVLPDYPVTADMCFPDEWFTEDCYEYYCQGNPRIILDVAVDNWAACLTEFMESVNVKSKIVAPIVQRRKDESAFVWGLLIVHACARHRQWQQSEAALLQQIADQMAIALQQAELYQQLQQELKERRQVQVSLQQSEALFRSLSEFSPVGIFRNDAEGNCIYTNPRWQEITGATFAEALGDGWQQFIHPDDLEQVMPQRSSDIVTMQASSVELRHIHKDGTIRLCQVKAAPILSTNQDLLGFVGTIEDITEIRAIEQMKNEFISIVSHELRTPLASIRGSLGLLASDVLKDDLDTAKHMLDIAAIETERLVRLVSDILDLERLESHNVLLDKQWCDANTLLQQSVEVLQLIADEKQIALSVSSGPVQLWAAPDRIIQTLVNLLSNAIKFSPPCSRVLLSADLQSNQVLFQVQDQGRGIPANKLEAIFGRFQQVDASDSRNEGGTGLGLAICRNIVQQHDGQIWVESTVGQGSTFYFTIPISLE
jgi:PAS domain S-box-containing protein